MSVINAYSGYYTEEKKILSSASGGAATFFSEHIISKGGIVFGVGYSQDFKSAEYYCAKNVDELKPLKSSKYIDAEKKINIDGEYKSLYSAVEEYLKAGNKILFIGLGCTVAALLKILEMHQIDVTNLYTMELVCHGATTGEVAKSYIDTLEKEHNSKLAEFTVRYKKDHWLPPYLYAKFENGTEYCAPFYSTEYGSAFSKYAKKSCYSCQFKGENHKADICVGDYVGLPKEHFQYNPKGVSVIFVQTGKGQAFIDECDDKSFKLSPTDREMALAGNPSYSESRKCYIDVDKFKKNLRERGLHYALVKSQGTFKYYLKKLLCH